MVAALWWRESCLKLCSVLVRMEVHTQAESVRLEKIYKLLCNNNAEESWKDANASMFLQREKWDIHGEWVDRPYVQGYSFVEK